MSIALIALQREAARAARFREHRLGRWEEHETWATAKCRDCPAQVTVNTKPMPNEIDIGGDAVAVNCPAGKN
jgi:hypothetical protein